MSFVETRKMFDRVAHLLESYSLQNTADNEGWKVRVQ